MSAEAGSQSKFVADDVVEAGSESGFIAEVAEVGTEASYVAAVVAVASSRGVTDPERLARIRLEARDVWESSLNQSYSGAPRGSSASN
jgi:hypothetical protein